MKRVLFLLLSLVAIYMPAQTWAQQPSSSNFNNYYISDMCGVVDLNQKVYNISKWATVSGTTLVALGTVLSVIGAEIEEEQLKYTDSVGCWQSQFGFFGLFFGGMTLIPALPFYLWGLHLESQPNGSALIVGENPKGWGGFVDFDYGFSDAIALSGSLGYNFSRQLYVGLGVGLECDFDEYQGPYGTAYMVPAYIDVRLRLGKTRIVPYIGLKGGFEVSSVPIPYGQVDWGVSHQPKDSRGAWWYSLCLSSSDNNTVSFKIARSF